MLNSKSEARNSKELSSPKSFIGDQLDPRFRGDDKQGLGHSNFKNSDFLRVSSFGFRASGLLKEMHFL